MKTNTKYNSIFRLLVVAVLSTFLVSCGSSRDSAFDDNDGIYSSSSSVETQDEDRNYYQQYFQTKAQAYSNIPEDEDVIFTDVEAYTSGDSYIDENGVIHEQHTSYSESYGPWGDSSEITINVYSNPGWGYYGYWHTPNWWHRSGWGLSYWGYGYGWGSYYGSGWGYPHYWSSWGYPYYAHNPYYNPYYGGYSNYVAYNRGRRNTDMNRSNRSVNRGTTTSTRSNRNYSRSEVERRINNSRNSQNVRNTTTQRSRNNTSTRTAPTNRNQNMRGSNNPRSTPASNTTRPSTNTRNSGTTTRGSNNVRSSGGTTTRSGGGSTPRRGGGRG